MAQAIEEEVARLVARVRDDRDLSDARRVDLLDRASAILGRLDRLHGDERDLLTTPTWQRLKAEIFEALAPWPDALRALAGLGGAQTGPAQ